MGSQTVEHNWVTNTFTLPATYFFLLSHSIMSDSLWPHGLQHTRLPCPSPSLRVCSNSCPLSWLFYPTISSSVVPFSSCLQSSPALGPFPMSWLFASAHPASISGSKAVHHSIPNRKMPWQDQRETKKVEGYFLNFEQESTFSFCIGASKLCSWPYA